MKRYVSLLATLAFALVAANPAVAIENGKDGKGNQFVVPIEAFFAEKFYGACSGTLLSPTIAITAGHCVVDSRGKVASSIYVGDPGSSYSSVSLDEKVLSVKITSTYRGGSDKTVQDDDLAFLILKSSRRTTSRVRLASESEIKKVLSTAGVSVTFVGYGAYGSNSKVNVTYPKEMTAGLSSWKAEYVNSAYLKSKSANSCKGDSGGPVILKEKGENILIGVLTGSPQNGLCTKRDADGNFYSMFTLVNRYGNLAFAAALSEIDRALKESSDAVLASVDTKLENATLVGEKAELTSKLAAAKNQIATLSKAVAALKEAASKKSK